MSLFNKYLTIIQEASYKKEKKNSAQFLTVSFDPEEFEKKLNYPKTYEFKGDNETNLSDEEIHQREMEKQNKGFETSISYTDPDEKYNKLKSNEINSHTLSGKLQVGNYSFTGYQKRMIFSDPDLAYTYAIHFKYNIKNEDFNDNISEEDMEKIEYTISKDYFYSNLYAKNILNIPLDKFKGRVKNRKRR